MPSSSHPPRHRLIAYGQGRLPDPEAETVEQHLADCVDCQQCVDTAPDDAIVGLVRAAIPSETRATGAVTRTEYRDLTHFAKGGLGEISIARDTAVGRDVAVKRLLPRPGDSSERQRRFLREAAITGRLEHPGIAPVYGIGEDESGQPCYAMRFVPGKTLLDAIKELHAAGPATPATVRPLLSRFVALCATVAYAHSRGVVHRDIKPANVAVGSFGETILLDWGLAQTEDVDEPSAGAERIASESFGHFRTETGAVLGTPGFMAPEQADGRRVGPAADIFSLGVTLRCILTGRASNEPADAKRFRVLNAIVERATATDPTARYRTPLDMAADIEGWLADEPVNSCPDPLLTRIRRWIRRHQATAAAAVGLLFAASVSLAIGAALLGREQQKTAHALDSESKERANAVAKEAETAAVLAYVDKYVFAAGRPKGRSGGQGKDVKLAEAVVAAGAAVEGSFPGQPLTQARVRAMLGTTLLNLGDAKSAEREFDIARKLYEERRGPDDPDTLLSASKLATSYRIQGRYKEALSLDEAVAASRKERLGPDHADTLRSLHSLADSYAALGREQDALKLDREVYNRRLATLGPDHRDTIASMASLASDHYALRQDDECLKLREIVYQRLLKLDGPDHADTIVAMNNLANVLGEVGRNEDALKMRTEVVERMRANSGPDHADTLMAMSNLARSHAALKRWADALDLHRKVLALRRSKFAPDHPETLVSMYNIGSVLQSMDRGDEAMAEFEEILRLAEGKTVNRLLVPSILERQVRHFANRKDPAACRLRAERWSKYADESAEYAAIAARLWSITSRGQAATAAPDAAVLARADADRAMALLTKAVAAGFDDAKELEQSDDFTALRGRDDFKKLIDSIREKKQQR
ncbi:MAG: serine/threonine-protein kinase [Gemmataceae bacterium]